MAPSTVVLITGVGRGTYIIAPVDRVRLSCFLTSSTGIGNALAAAYLLRSNHTVVGSVRDVNAPKAQELSNLPTATGSRLLLVNIENTSTTDAKKAIDKIETAGVDHVDVVISNAGVSPDPAPLDSVDPRVLVDAFSVNTVSSVLLFQAVHKLLTKASAPKWVSVSSRAGSIGQAADFYWYISPYGMSKAAQNWFTA